MWQDQVIPKLGFLVISGISQTINISDFSKFSSSLWVFKNHQINIGLQKFSNEWRKTLFKLPQKFWNPKPKYQVYYRLCHKIFSSSQWCECNFFFDTDDIVVVLPECNALDEARHDKQQNILATVLPSCNKMIQNL